LETNDYEEGEEGPGLPWNEYDPQGTVYLREIQVLERRGASLRVRIGLGDEPSALLQVRDRAL